MTENVPNVAPVVPSRPFQLQLLIPNEDNLTSIASPSLSRRSILRNASIQSYGSKIPTVQFDDDLLSNISEARGLSLSSLNEKRRVFKQVYDPVENIPDFRRSYSSRSLDAKSNQQIGKTELSLQGKAENDPILSQVLRLVNSSNVSSHAFALDQLLDERWDVGTNCPKCIAQWPAKKVRCCFCWSTKGLFKHVSAMLLINELAVSAAKFLTHCSGYLRPILKPCSEVCVTGIYRMLKHSNNIDSNASALNLLLSVSKLKEAHSVIVACNPLLRYLTSFLTTTAVPRLRFTAVAIFKQLTSNHNNLQALAEVQMHDFMLKHLGLSSFPLPKINVLATSVKGNTKDDPSMACQLLRCLTPLFCMSGLGMQLSGVAESRDNAPPNAYIDIMAELGEMLLSSDSPRVRRAVLSLLAKLAATPWGENALAAYSGHPNILTELARLACDASSGQAAADALQVLWLILSQMLNSQSQAEKVARLVTSTQLLANLPKCMEEVFQKTSSEAAQGEETAESGSEEREEIKEGRGQSASTSDRPHSAGSASSLGTSTSFVIPSRFQSSSSGSSHNSQARVPAQSPQAAPQSTHKAYQPRPKKASVKRKPEQSNKSNLVSAACGLMASLVLAGSLAKEAVQMGVLSSVTRVLKAHLDAVEQSSALMLQHEDKSRGRPLTQQEIKQMKAAADFILSPSAVSMALCLLSNICTICPEDVASSSEAEGTMLVLMQPLLDALEVPRPKVLAQCRMRLKPVGHVYALASPGAAAITSLYRSSLSAASIKKMLFPQAAMSDAQEFELFEKVVIAQLELSAMLGRPAFPGEGYDLLYSLSALIAAMAKHDVTSQNLAGMQPGVRTELFGVLFSMSIPRDRLPAEMVARVRRLGDASLSACWALLQGGLVHPDAVLPLSLAPVEALLQRLSLANTSREQSDSAGTDSESLSRLISVVHLLIASRTVRAKLVVSQLMLPLKMLLDWGSKRGGDGNMVKQIRRKLQPSRKKNEATRKVVKQIIASDD